MNEQEQQLFNKMEAVLREIDRFFDPWSEEGLEAEHKLLNLIQELDDYRGRADGADERQLTEERKARAEIKARINRVEHKIAAFNPAIPPSTPAGDESPQTH